MNELMDRANALMARLDLVIMKINELYSRPQMEHSNASWVGYNLFFGVDTGFPSINKPRWAENEGYSMNVSIAIDADEFIDSQYTSEWEGTETQDECGAGHYTYQPILTDYSTDSHWVYTGANVYSNLYYSRLEDETVWFVDVFYEPPVINDTTEMYDTDEYGVFELEYDIMDAGDFTEYFDSCSDLLDRETDLMIQFPYSYSRVSIDFYSSGWDSEAYAISTLAGGTYTEEIRYYGTAIPTDSTYIGHYSAGNLPFV